MLSSKSKEEAVAEALDPTKVTLYCKQHNYYGPTKLKFQGKIKSAPQLGCKNCWMVFYIHELANTPPDLRRERLEEIEEVLNKVVESVENGTWDFKPHAHPEITIEKE